MTRPTERFFNHSPLRVATDPSQGWVLTLDLGAWIETGRHLHLLGSVDHPMVSSLLTHLRQTDGLRLIALRTTPVARDWEARTPSTLNLLAMPGPAAGVAPLTVWLEHLALLLGSEEIQLGTQRTVLRPRTLTSLEYGLLAHALATLIADQDGGPRPTLPALIEVLEGFHERKAHDLARRLSGRWSGVPADPSAPTLTAEGWRFFAAPSDDDAWALRDGDTVFDFSPLPEVLHPFFRSYALGQVAKGIGEEEPRGGAPRTVLVLEDLADLRVLPSRLDFLANLAMVGRSRGVALVLVDACPLPGLSTAEQMLRSNCLELLLEEDGGISLMDPERRMPCSLVAGTAHRTPEEPPMGRGRTVRRRSGWS